MICRECHGQFEDSEPKCPYCGAVNELGAEKEYMQDMEDLKEDLEDLGDIPAEQIGKEVTSHLKFTGKIVIITVIALVVLAALTWFAAHFFDIADRMMGREHSPETMREQMLWEEENFPQLDAWYAEQDFDSLLAFEDQMLEEDSPYNLYNWEHSSLLTYYRQYLECMRFAKRIREGGTVAFYEVESCLYDVMSIRYYADINREMLGEDDWAYVSGWAEELDFFLPEIYQMSEEEIAELSELATQNGYLEYKPVMQYAEKLKDRFMIK